MADKGLNAQMVKMMTMVQESINAQSEKHDKAMEAIAKRLSSEETIDTSKSLFSHRFACINITREGESPVKYTNKVNALCEAAALDKIGVDGWKVFFWLRGLDPITDHKQLAYFLKHVEQKMEKEEAVKINDICAEWQQYQRQSSVLNEGDKAVKAVRAQKYDKQKSQKPSTREESRGEQCWNCGRSGHKKPECSQALTKCFNCQKTGHLSKFGKSKRSSGPKRTQNVKVVGGTAAEDVQVNSVRQYVSAIVEGKSVDFRLDTGSDITLIGKRDWERIGEPTLEKYTAKVTSASGNELKLLGRARVKMELKGSTSAGYVYVREHGNLLGLDWIEKSSEMAYHLDRMVNAVSLTKTESIQDELREKFPEVFKESLGRCTKERAILTVKEGASPVYKPKRKVPYAELEVVEEELNRLEGLRALKKDMCTPQEEKELRAFMGMITYYGAFIPQMKTLRGPMDVLLEAKGCVVFGFKSDPLSTTSPNRNRCGRMWLWYWGGYQSPDARWD
ncbi:unnamed protein product [Caenorhabditis nigoni]